MKHHQIGSYTVSALLTLLLITSCQKEVKVNLATTPPKLVVQGQIENNLPPIVLLTTSVGFFSSVDFSTLQNIFVHDATVRVTDGRDTVRLREYSIDTMGGTMFYLWSIDTNSGSRFFTGELERYYTLIIDYKGTTYTSTTKIPTPKGPDSLFFAPPNLTPPGTPKTALELFCSYKDPDTLGNYVRYFTSRNGDALYPGGLYSDELVNGKYLASVDLFAGFNDSAKANIDSLLFFYPGDTVLLKWCNIDKGVYDFWNTYQFSVQAGGNPFATPINLKSNISNGALGVWSGYGSIYYTAVVK